MKTFKKAKLERPVMSDPEIAQNLQPKEQDPLEQEAVPQPTDESLPNPVVPLVQGITTTTSQREKLDRYICKICKKEFNSKAELDMHLESQHQNQQKQNQTQQKTTKRHQRKSQNNQK